MVEAFFQTIATSRRSPISSIILGHFDGHFSKYNFIFQNKSAYKAAMNYIIWVK